MAIDAYLTTTINGMIALPNGDAPWSDATWKAYYKLAKKYPAVILGHTTYDIILNAAPDEFKKLGNPRVLVLSRKLKKTADKKHTVVASAKNARTLLKKARVKNALITGGAKTLSLFLKAGVVDRLIIDIEPQIFAKGIPLINLPGQWHATYTALSVRKPSPKVVRLTYSKPA